MPCCPGIDLAAVGAWHIRGLPQALPFQSLDIDAAAASVDELVVEAKRAFAAGRERRSFLASFVAGLQRGGATLVNPPAAARQHFLKLDQLELLRGAGVPVPRTLASNDPEAVVAFARELSAPLVCKPLAGGGLCRRAGAHDLRRERLRALAAAPVLFQEEVQGRNIRVYVVGGEVAAAYEIVSEELDYRGAETDVLVTTPSDAESRPAAPPRGRADAAHRHRRAPPRRRQLRGARVQPLTDVRRDRAPHRRGARHSGGGRPARTLIDDYVSP